MNGFFQGRLINRKVGFLDTIEKNNLQTGIKSKKKKKKAKSNFFLTLQEEWQAFGHTLKP